MIRDDLSKNAYQRARRAAKKAERQKRDAAAIALWEAQQRPPTEAEKAETMAILDRLEKAIEKIKRDDPNWNKPLTRTTHRTI